MSRQRLPQSNGRIHLPHLKNEVSIRRDRWGVPHIRAASRADLFFAQGFVHAQDRLWQMELNRRVANGQLAALFGAVALDSDRLTRTLGFRRLAHRSLEIVGQQTLANLSAYAAGVNAFLNQGGKLPIEFTLTRCRPDAWTMADSAAIGRLQAWAMTVGWAGELSRAQLLELLGPELFGELEDHYPAENPVTLPAGLDYSQLQLDPMLRASAGALLGQGMDGGGRGSNAWVIGPERSATGNAILCNDMHLPVTTPSLWYYIHLRSEAADQEERHFRAAGVSLPGLPYIVAGHNGRIAWGATLTYADAEDLFIEKLHPQDDGRYLFRGEWREAQVIAETIAVKNRPDFTEKVIVTHHGPIVSGVIAGADPAELGQAESRLAIAMSSTALRADHSLAGFAGINEAHDWQSFLAAAAHIESPNLNLLYADRQNNIGYVMAGAVPIRAQGDGRLPAPGWSGEYEWTGQIPFAETPRAFNPPQGYIVSCNQRIAGDDYPHFLGQTWMNGYRARRLEQLITASEKVSLADCRRFQFDVYSIPGAAMVKRLAGLETDDEDAALSLRLLRQWDGHLTTKSVGGAVYQVFANRLTHMLLEERLGEKMTLKLLGVGPHPLLAPVSELYGHWITNLLEILDNSETAWLPAGRERDVLLIRALAETTVELRQRLGESHHAWQWGRLHQITMEHALSPQPPLDYVFDLGPFPMGGDTNTVFQTAVMPGKEYANKGFSISQRHIMDMGNLAHTEAIIAPGQSGQLGSPHYDDLIEPWLKGEYFTVAWEEEQIVARDILTLSPKSKKLNVMRET